MPRFLDRKLEFRVVASTFLPPFTDLFKYGTNDYSRRGTHPGIQECSKLERTSLCPLCLFSIEELETRQLDMF